MTLFVAVAVALAVAGAVIAAVHGLGAAELALRRPQRSQGRA
jgi:hypothetical protein